MHEKLRHLLHVRGWGAGDLIEALGDVSGSVVRRWIKGTEEARQPRIAQLVRMARILGVPVAYLVDDAIETVEQATGELDLEARAVMEEARRLGLERAGWMLKTANILGWTTTRDRLLSATLGGEAEDVPLRDGDDSSSGRRGDHKPNFRGLAPKPHHKPSGEGNPKQARK